MRKKDRGDAGALIETGICMLALITMVAGFFFLVEMTQMKENVNQIARSTILRMECQGYLGREDMDRLLLELGEQGLEQIDLTGTTFEYPGYGQKICLCIAGVWGKRYEVFEKRVSTAKG